MINFHDCSFIDKASIILAIIFLMLSFLSAYFVYSNETKNIESKHVVRDLFGGHLSFFTGKYLNETGKRWRIPYVVSVLYIILWVIYVKNGMQC